MKKLYCISGLGADKRVFQNVAVNGYELVHVPWPVYDKHDEVPCYAQKVSALIPGDRPHILGVSFGGMIAVEIARQRPVGKVIIVSSAKSSSELPPSKGLFKFITTSDIIPSSLFTIPNRFVIDMFGAENDEQRNMLRSIIKDTDGGFMKWAFKAMGHWQSIPPPAGIYHIHGTADKIIPPENVKPDVWIQGGGHIMIYNRAAEINPLLSRQLA